MPEDTAAKAYHTISEVSEMLKVRPHVLRYWETQFSMLKPKKSRSGMRLYETKDIELLVTIRSLLYERGFKIAGARRKLLDSGRKAGAEQLSLTGTAVEASRLSAIVSIRDEIRGLVRELRK